MKKISLIILILIHYSFTQAQIVQPKQEKMKGMDMPKKDTAKKTLPQTYTCPMHPQIHASKPGKCPICGMQLVKEKIKKTALLVVNKDNEMPMAKDTTSINKMDKMNMDVTTQQKNTGNPVRTIINNKASKKVRYDLYVSDTTVNFTGKNAHAMAINGTIPAPTLEFTEGDTAEIYVHNLLASPTSMHWHGLLLPNQYDGVTYLTTAPIMPDSTHLFTFPIIQNGTMWYHSHDLMEQIGLYGAIVIHKKENDITNREEDKLPSIVAVISEWTNENPVQINRSLHNATDWYSIKKGSTQDYGAAIKKGYFKTKLKSEWKRMLAMDVADIYYDRFLINGKNNQKQTQFKKGDKVRMRIINAGASSYFWLQYAGGKISVIANDGKDVRPVTVDRLIIGNGETYDIVLTIPDNMSYELKATPEDRTKFASIFLGDGMEMKVPEMQRLNYFAGMKMMNSMMNMNGTMDDMGMKMSMQKMDMNSVMYPELNISEEKEMKMDETEMKGMNHTAATTIATLNYGMLSSTSKTNLPKASTKVIRFELTGNMSIYLWTMDNKTMAESDMILIKKGENVQMILHNNTMMRHPMHLHGHYFRVLNGQGDYSPLKNTLDILPMETDTIEFAGNETGNWFFHCHILYHMAAGMGRILSYENSPSNPEIPNVHEAMKKLMKGDKVFYTMANIGLETNGSEGFYQRSNTRWLLKTMWHLGLKNTKGYESETTVGRYIGKMQWLMPYIGFDYHYKKNDPFADKNIFGNDDKNALGQISNRNNRKAGVVGIIYTLPMFLLADARIDTDGKLRFQLGREDIPLTNRLRLNFMLNTDKEYMTGFRYVVSKYFSLSAHYDSDMGLGAGLALTY
jgi:FtsP/CotA-like multicopper oxidase with cupredoxin domain